MCRNAIFPTLSHRTHCIIRYAVARSVRIDVFIKSINMFCKFIIYLYDYCFNFFSLRNIINHSIAVILLQSLFFPLRRTLRVCLKSTIEGSKTILNKNKIKCHMLCLSVCLWVLLKTDRIVRCIIMDCGQPQRQYKVVPPNCACVGGRKRLARHTLHTAADCDL